MSVQAFHPDRNETPSGSDGAMSPLLLSEPAAPKKLRAKLSRDTYADECPQLLAIVVGSGGRGCATSRRYGTRRSGAGPLSILARTSAWVWVLLNSTNSGQPVNPSLRAMWVQTFPILAPAANG